MAVHIVHQIKNSDDDNNHHELDLTQIQPQCHTLEPPEPMHKKMMDKWPYIDLTIQYIYQILSINLPFSILDNNIPGAC